MADDPAQAELDSIYGLPLNEFTAARNAAAKELAAEGDPEAAERVRSARKPTVAAWALNQLKRGEARRLNAFAKAVRGLEEAQRALIEEGDRDAFTKASDAHRRALEALVDAALDAAAEAGSSRSAGLEDKVTSTLQAATSDPEVLELLRAGRLDRERVSSAGLEALPGSSAPQVKTGAKRSKGEAAARRRVETERRRARKAQEKVERAESALEHAREAAGEAERNVRRAQAAVREAKAELATATERIAKLEPGTGA